MGIELLWSGLTEALSLVADLDPSIVDATVRTVWVSLAAVTAAAVVGLPLGTLLARFPGRATRVAVLGSRAGMAVPTVFIGIVCYAAFSRRGPLGPLEVLYTPTAIVVGELLLALPIITAITHGAVSSLDRRVAETATTLGAGPLLRWLTDLSEARTGILLALLTAFARCVSELGIAMMVGGNIAWRTRTLATATALETGKGEFERGLAMGIILVCIALGVMALSGALTRESEP